MRRAVLFVLVLILSQALTSQPAQCTFCPTWRCFGDCGFDSCVCLTPPGKVGGGACWGVEGEMRLLSRGYHRYGQ